MSNRRSRGSFQRDDDSPPKKPNFNTTSLEDLQSGEQQELLNEIDRLRGCGISDLVNLPQLVVCGDQSSGKSSVLEAITEIPFPRKDVLCTRFATEIVLRRSPETKVIVSIIPGQDRTDNEREELARFSRTLKDFRDLPSLVEAAGSAMGIASTGSFARDVLSIEISGPNRPQLTIVDLPGLIHTANRSQTAADVALVSELCHSYISNPRTIILAIVTAMNDIANQVILKRAREVDPDGIRTLGIITKPDTLPANSDIEKSFVSLANNEDVQFSLGWHVVKNRGYENRDVSFAERNQAEAEFFSQGVWKDFPKSCLGITSLRARLSALLLDHIKHELPKVFAEIRVELDACEKRLSGFGHDRKTPEEQKRYLSSLSQTFERLCKSATDGSYEDLFFGDILTEEGTQRRLRSVIENYNLLFAKIMRKYGHRMQIVPEDEPESSSLDPRKYSTIYKSKDHKPPQKISRSDTLEWVKTIFIRCRGIELPGTSNPLLISELFWDLSKRWGDLAQEHMNDIWEACQMFVRMTLKELTNEDVFKSLFAMHLDRVMEERLADAKLELQRLLTDRRKHATTYNNYYTADVLRERNDRRRQTLSIKLSSFLGQGESLLPAKIDVDTTELLAFLSDQSPDGNMDTSSCIEALDCMLAYYKVALKKFIDNVAVEVIERRIVGDLWKIFSPASIDNMDQKTITAIASESPEAYKQRTQLEAKRDRLRKGMSACRNALSGIGSSPNTSSGTGELPTTPKGKKNRPKRRSRGSPGSFESGEEILPHDDSDGHSEEGIDGFSDGE